MIVWRKEKCCFDCKYCHVEEKYHRRSERRWCTRHPEWIEVDLSGHLAEHILHTNGYDTINPSKIHIEGLEYEELLQVDFRLIDLCDGILVQDNWTDSEGAAREKAYAMATGKPVYRMTVGGKIYKEV